MKDISSHIENRELLYAGSFSRTEVTPYGILCWNREYPHSIQGNHAVVLDKDMINGQTAGAVEMFYVKRGLIPAFMLKENNEVLKGFLSERNYEMIPVKTKLYVAHSRELVTGHSMGDVSVCRKITHEISNLAEQYDNSGWILEKLLRLSEKKKFYLLYSHKQNGVKSLMTYQDMGSYARVGDYITDTRHDDFRILTSVALYFHSRRCHKPMAFALEKRPELDGISEGIDFIYAVMRS